MSLTKQDRQDLFKDFFQGDPTAGNLSSRLNRFDSTQLPVSSVSTEDIEPQKKSGFFSRLGERFKSAGTDITSAIGRSRRGEQTKLETGFQAIGEGVGAIAGTAFDALFTGATNLVKAVTPDVVEEQIGKAGKAFLETDVGQAGVNAILKGEDAYSDWKAKHPRLVGNLEGALGLLEGVGLGRAVKVAPDLALRGARAIPGVAERQAARAAKQVEEVIAPKLTQKEIKLALSEGRVVRKSGPVRKALGIPDKVVQTQRVQNAARVVVDKIPDATKLNNQQLADAAKQEISKISKELEPRLKKIAVKEQDLDDIINSWADVKELQLESPILTEEQVRRAQAGFEKILQEAVDAKNADDVWKLVQDYDDRVKTIVKEATAQSPETLQELKDIWLENRRILRDSLDDIVENADDSVKKEFQDMSGLYTARQNIINNAEFFKGNRGFRKLLAGTLVGSVLGGGTVASFID